MIETGKKSKNEIKEMGHELNNAIDSVGISIKNVMTVSGEAIDELLDVVGDKLEIIPIIGNGIDIFLDHAGNIAEIALKAGGIFFAKRIDRLGDLVEEFVVEATETIDIAGELDFVL